jgi:hypothetical protein
MIPHKLAIAIRLEAWRSFSTQPSYLSYLSFEISSFRIMYCFSIVGHHGDVVNEYIYASRRVRSI